MPKNTASSEQETEHDPKNEPSKTEQKKDLDQEPQNETSKAEQEKDLDQKPVTLSAEDYRKLSKDAKEFQEKYWRLLAESENSRKRLQKERQEMNHYTVKNILMDFLQPLDTLEGALNAAEHASDEIKNWAIGFQMILNQFKDILTGYNVKPFSAEGLFFDPHHHEAVETEETDKHPDGLILKEFLRGYKMGDKTIRPARVKVAKTPKPKKPESSHEANKEIEAETSKKEK